MTSWSYRSGRNRRGAHRVLGADPSGHRLREYLARRHRPHDGPARGTRGTGRHRARRARTGSRTDRQDASSSCRSAPRRVALRDRQADGLVGRRPGDGERWRALARNRTDAPSGLAGKGRGASAERAHRFALAPAVLPWDRCPPGPAPAAGLGGDGALGVETGAVEQPIPRRRDERDALLRRPWSGLTPAFSPARSTGGF